MSTVPSTSGNPDAVSPASARNRIRDSLARAAHFACTTQAPYQAAVFRIGLAAVVAAFLLREWPYRRVLYGDRSPLSFDMNLALVREARSFTVLSWWSGQLWFETVYALTIVTAFAVMVGWRTRTMSVLFMVGVLSLEFRNSLLGHGGDNIIRIMVIYLVFTRCAEVWSLDARRARTRRAGDVRDRTGIALWSATGLLLPTTFTLQEGGWPWVLLTLWAAQGIWYTANRWFPGYEGRALLDSCVAMLHNCAMLVIAVQVCLIYATAGLYKVQGLRWQDGSALYYALNLDYFTPFPGLSAALTANMLIVLTLSYVTVILQVAFPFTLFNRKIKNVLLAVLIAEHLGIAVLMGIPMLSLAMIACDAVFLPTAFLLWAQGRLTSPPGWLPKWRPAQ